MRSSVSQNTLHCSAHPVANALLCLVSNRDDCSTFSTTCQGCSLGRRISIQVPIIESLCSSHILSYIQSFAEWSSPHRVSFPIKEEWISQHLPSFI